MLRSSFDSLSRWKPLLALTAPLLLAHCGVETDLDPEGSESGGAGTGGLIDDPGESDSGKAGGWSAGGSGGRGDDPGVPHSGTAGGWAAGGSAGSAAGGAWGGGGNGAGGHAGCGTGGSYGGSGGSYGGSAGESSGGTGGIIIGTGGTGEGGSAGTGEGGMGGTGPGDCAPVPDGIVAWYPGDGDATDLMGGPSGVLLGGAHPVSGHVAGALAFEGGDDQVLVPNSTALKFGTGDFSVAFWINSSTSGYVDSILDKRVYDGGYRGYHVYLWYGKIGFQLADGQYTNYDSGVRVNDGQWHHVAITVDRDRALTFYIDGVAVKVDDPARHPGSVDNGSHLALGSRSFEQTGFWPGSLDELMLGNREWSADEVAELYAAGDLGACKP